MCSFKHTHAVQKVSAYLRFGASPHNGDFSVVRMLSYSAAARSGRFAAVLLCWLCCSYGVCSVAVGILRKLLEWCHLARLKSNSSSVVCVPCSWTSPQPRALAILLATL
jgi:hypothetical protein